MRIAFVGDVCADASGALWRNARLPDLHRELDVEHVVANFEAVVDGSTNGAPAPDKVCLSVPRAAAGRLADAGIDFISVANNHSADYGADAFDRSLSHLAGVFGQRGVFGTRERPTAELAPGLDVLGACFPEANPCGTARGDGPLLLDGVVDLVNRYRSAGRQLAVFAHWGEEQIGLASPRQRAWARALVADGAAQVIGCHAHVTGSGEDIEDASVIYSLGNFLFRAMQGGGTRLLGSNRRSAAAIYEWNGERLCYERWMDCRFDERLNLTIREGTGRFPGGWWERVQLASPEAFAERLYATALATRSLRIGATKVMTGIERPSLRKLRTAARLLGHRQD